MERELSIHRQRQLLRGYRFRVREISSSVAQLSKGRLQVNRYWIVDRSLNTLLPQCVLKPVTLLNADSVHMVHVARAGHLLRNVHVQTRERFRIPPSMLTPRLCPPFQMPQLYPQDRTLQPLHPVVKSLEYVLVLLFLPPVTQHTDPARVLFVIGQDHSPFAVSTEILARIEAKASQVSQTAASPTFVFGTVRLRRVLDHD